LGFSPRSNQKNLRSNRKLVIHLNLMQHNNTVSRLYHFNPRNQNDVGQPFTFHLSLQDSSRTDPWFGRNDLGTVGLRSLYWLPVAMFLCSTLGDFRTMFFGFAPWVPRVTFGVGSCAVHVCLGSAAKKKSRFIQNCEGLAAWPGLYHIGWLLWKIDLKARESSWTTVRCKSNIVQHGAWTGSPSPQGAVRFFPMITSAL
jgi:hypothetical protein